MSFDNIDGERSQYTLWEILSKLPIEEAIPRLKMIQEGINAACDIHQTAVEIYKNAMDEDYKKMCFPILTMEMCLKWLKIERIEYPQAKYLFIYVEETLNPRNENDKYSVLTALLDENKKTINIRDKRGGSIFEKPKENRNMNGQEIICMVVPTGNLDEKILRVLNGENSIMIKL